MKIIDTINESVCDLYEYVQNLPIVETMSHRFADLTEVAGNYHQFSTDRAFYSGLAITTGLTATAAYLFQVATPMTGALFGVANFALLFFSIEALRSKTELDVDSPLLNASLVLAGGLVTQAFMHTVLNKQLNTKAAAILTVTAFAGQCLRACLVAENT